MLEVEYKKDKLALNNNAAAVTLYGRNDSANVIKGYEPAVLMPLKNLDITLDKAWSIEFEVYNASNVDKEFIVYFERTTSQGVSVVADYDRFILKAGEWRKVCLDNFNVISRDATALAQYQKVGLRCSNLLGNYNIPTSLTLYIDNITIRKK